jgi:hypothetical protein
MPSWAVTGKLGGGKTLWAVRMIRRYLVEGRPVATNIDIFPENFLSPVRDETNFCLYRLPNTISRLDLDNIGVANKLNDETKNGLLVIDESGVSLNARSYNDSGRKELIEWFLHARKLGWDLMFIVQSVSLIDKQIREAILEYRAVCKRMDRLSVPILVWFGIKIKMPRFHFVVIRYGMEANATIADRDVFFGNDLFSAFNTKQLLVDARNQVGVYSVLSPWHLKGKYMSKLQLVRSAAVAACVVGLVVGGLLGWFSKVYFDAQQPAVVAAAPPAAEPELAVGLVYVDGNIFPNLILQDGRKVKIFNIQNQRSDNPIYLDSEGKRYQVKK